METHHRATELNLSISNRRLLKMAVYLYINSNVNHLSSQQQQVLTFVDVMYDITTGGEQFVISTHVARYLIASLIGL